MILPASAGQSFSLISVSQLRYFPEHQRGVIKERANAFYNLLESCRSFEIDNTQPSPSEAKNRLISQLDGEYQSIFDSIHPLVSFATSRSQDFSELGRQARAVVQEARDLSVSLVKEIEEKKTSVENILQEVRAAAVEQGVSKQAIHFKNEADFHHRESDKWRKYTIRMSIVLGVYALISLFFHHIPGVGLASGYLAVQLAISKVLIFSVIAYMLFLCARNFLSHKHNEIVNRHRQNALATFTALAEATSDAASSDIVLSHAAACIFSPQDTGYAKGENKNIDSVQSFQLVPRIGNLASSSGS